MFRFCAVPFWSNLKNLGGKASHRFIYSPYATAAASSISEAPEDVSNYSVDLIRNIGIIAHVDHGKTTLVDCLLKQSGCLKNVEDNGMVRIMDSNELERERGITILSKCTSIRRGKYHINIVDTPGHADFGGEVERILNMVDGVLLLVDASSGPQAQTKFVLGKALAQGLRPIVVQNKVDRETARCEEVDNEVLDLFMSLEATDEQLNYPTFYASAKMGWALRKNPFSESINLSELKPNMEPLFDAIIEYFKPPQVNVNAPFSFLANSLEHQAFFGKCQMGRIMSGSISVGDEVKALSEDGKVLGKSKIGKIFIRAGLERFSIGSARAGDIVTLSGIPEASVNSTICHPSVTEPLKSVPLDPPTITVYFTINDSPIGGKEGKILTMANLQDRLRKEAEVNIALTVGNTIDGKFIAVQGRGELQMGVLIETMRREGHEFSVSPPQILFRPDPENPSKQLEPIEEIIVDVDAEFQGKIMEKMALRKCELISMDEVAGKSRLVYHGATRFLVGFSSELKNECQGTAVMTRTFLKYAPHLGVVIGHRKGALISCGSGPMTANAIQDLEKRGKCFYPPGTEAYPGMVVGESNTEKDVDLNPCRVKAITSVRMEYKEQTSTLKVASMMKLEDMLAYMREDELLEVTPKNFRLRKMCLDADQRKTMIRKLKQSGQK